MAHGDSYNSLAGRFRIGTSTVSKVVSDTCQVIWDSLKATEMPKVSEDNWKEIAAGFRERWKFPNCIGAVDGKHCVIQCPPKTNTEFYNYKHQYSVNLMAMVDHQYRFTYINVGSYGSNADSSVFRNSRFGRAIMEGTMKIPPPEALPDTPDVVLPHVIVADAAFPLNAAIMRPYPSFRNAMLPMDQMIYNFRHSHARIVSENAFGIVVQRWRIFTRKICLRQKNAVRVIKAACMLHNYLQDDRSVEQIMRELCPDGPVPALSMQPMPRLPGYRSPRDAMEIRDEFKDYFSGAGALPWQENYVRKRQGLD